MTRKPDKFEVRARELCLEAGVNPDSRVNQHFRHNGRPKSIPAWCAYRDAAMKEQNTIEANKIMLASATVELTEYSNKATLSVYGSHEPTTLAQMHSCMKWGKVIGGVLCADGHLGYAQPVGGVIAYENQISVSGVGFDIGCGNMAVKLDLPFTAIEDKVGSIAKDIGNILSFGVGRKNDERVEHALFDDEEAWKASDMEDYRPKAEGQLGTIGSGNHYVDIMVDQDGMVWIGVHFGSRGLGHTSATKYLKLAGGKDGINVPPTILDEGSELGIRYIQAMELAGRYAYAGREWVVERVRKIVGGTVTDSVHNHHNFAWRETHNGKDLWVVRKGATPAFPGQRGFVGGSMGDDAVIIEGVDTPEAKEALHSTIHGAGRNFGRKEAKRRFTKEQMYDWLKNRGVTLVGADLDESPMAYRRLNEVLAQTKGIRVTSVLKPVVVVMAGSAEFDPFKD